MRPGFAKFGTKNKLWTDRTPVPMFFGNVAVAKKGVASCSGCQWGSPTPDGHLHSSIDDGWTGAIR